MRLILAVLGLVIWLPFASSAAVKALKFEPNKLDRFFDQGIAVGVEAGRAFSITGINKKSENQNGLSESISINVGDGLGRKLTGSVGFFQVAVEKDPARLVIDLTQMQRTKVDERQLAAVFRDSGFIKSTEMTMDPEDFSTNLTFFLKKPVRVKVSSPEKQGQILIKIEEESAKRIKKIKKNKKENKENKENNNQKSKK
ncbi:MAG: hypothetical protein SGJ18_11015 [Pseudomonadota bacterium]|nr:hypothetical protein [Pseudomonadota bacterium]